MKPGLRCLPNEVWVDVFSFPWISRSELGKIVHKLGNPTIVEILQYILHERGKQTLGTIHLDTWRIIPRTPLPENIKSFGHLDSSTLHFLRHISGLFTGVNLKFSSFEKRDDLPKLRTILDHLAPLLHGVHSLEFDQSAIPLLQQSFGPKLAQVKMLEIGVWRAQLNINFCMDWLTSEERDPAEPRLLKYTYSNTFQQFSTALRQQFQSAKKRCTFAILIYYCDNDDPLDFHLENSLGEQLHGQYDGAGHFRIDRHQANAGPALVDWIKETIDKCYHPSSNWIVIDRDVTIGPIDEVSLLMRMLTSW